MDCLLRKSIGMIGLVSVACAFLFALIWQGSSRAGGAQSSVENLYLDKCSVCHGPDGRGKTAKGKKLKVKDLHSPEVQKMSDDEMSKIIAKGKGANMDGYEKELTKDQIKELVAYYRELGKKP